MRAQSTLPMSENAKTTKPAGGYRLIPVGLIAAVWFAFREGLLRVIDVRAFFACQEMTARRLAARTLGKPSKFTLEELLALTGGSKKRLKASLDRLQAVGILSFSEAKISFAGHRSELHFDLNEFRDFLDEFPNHKRLLPVPRRILRVIAGGARSSLIATILGHLIWGLYRTKEGLFNAAGRLKASWIAETFGVAISRVKAARRELVDLGWLVPDDAKQWEHNRWGEKFHINLLWSRGDASTSTATATVGASPAVQAPIATTESAPPPSVSPQPVVSPVPAVEVGGTKLGPPPPVFGTKLGPPIETRISPNGELKNQKPGSAGPAGVYTSQGTGEKTSSSTGQEKAKPVPDAPVPPGPPTIKHIVPEDLKETPRLMNLHGQAVEAGLIGSSENDRLRFFAAAEHARIVGSQNPPGLFSRLVRAKLWKYLTQDDEDAANGRLKTFLFGGAPRKVSEDVGGLCDEVQTVPQLSDDARFVRDISNVLRVRGVPESSTWRLVFRERPEWTRERWDNALRELGR